MARRSLLVGLIVLVLGCGSRLVAGDDEAANASESSEDQATETSLLETESEVSDTEVSDTESTDTESTDTESTDESTGEPECGNGRIEEGEQCEGDDLDGVDCVVVGYDGGTLSCDPIRCTFDDSNCTLLPPACGNGSLEGDEACDVVVPWFWTCTVLGYEGGTLACNDPCLVDGVPVECPHGCSLDATGCLSAGEGGPCASEVDCPETAPFCTNDTCWAGAEGDPCLEPDDCVPGLDCNSNGECWNGSEGDPCLVDTDCSQGTPQCAFGHCYDGVWGSPCASQDDCSFAFFCVDAYCTQL